MKKIILTAAAVLALTFANAQEEKQGMKIGIKAGWVSSSLSVDGDIPEPDDSSSAYFGALVDLSITNKFHVQPELLYSMEGGDGDFGLDFISVPIMAKWYFTDNFNIQAGPQIAFVAGGDDEIKDNSKSTDWRASFGAAYEFDHLFIDARYNMGLTDMSDIDGVEIKTASWNVGLGWRFF